MKDDAVELAVRNRPEIVCLCGSTRFVDTFNDARKRLTYEDKIVLSIEIETTQAKDEDPQYVDPEVKRRLDELHLRKIDLADRVHVLNVDGYIGESTRREIQYAQDHDKRITWLRPDKAQLADAEPALVDSLVALGRTYGPLGVALTAVSLTDQAVLLSRLNLE